MKKIICDGCGKEFEDEDFKKPIYKGGSVLFSLKIEISGDYCLKCQEKGLRTAERVQ